MRGTRSPPGSQPTATASTREVVLFRRRSTILGESFKHLQTSRPIIPRDVRLWSRFVLHDGSIVSVLQKHMLRLHSIVSLPFRRFSPVETAQLPLLERHRSFLMFLDSIAGFLLFHEPIYGLHGYLPEIDPDPCP